MKLVKKPMSVSPLQGVPPKNEPTVLFLLCPESPTVIVPPPPLPGGPPS